MTPQAGCSCSTVIPSATASGDANAATTSLIGPAGISAAPARRATRPSSRSANRRRPGSGAARRGARPGRRWSRSADRRPAREPERRAQPRPLPLRPDGDRDARRRRWRRSRTGRCSGGRCRAGPGRPPDTNAFWAWLTRTGQRRAEERDIDALARAGTGPRRRARARRARRGRRPRRACPVRTSLIATPTLVGRRRRRPGRR